MNLNAFFQVSVSVFSIVATIFMITLFIWAIIIKLQLGKLIKKLEDISETAKTTVGEAKDFVEHSIKSLESFKNSIFTFDFVRRVVSEIINFKNNNSKGVKNGKTE